MPSLRRLLVATLTCWAATAWADAPSPQRVETAGIALAVSVNAEVTTQRLGDGQTLVVVTEGRAVLLLTVYRAKRVPTLAKALDVHEESIHERYGQRGGTVKRLPATRVALLKKRRKARAILVGSDEGQRVVRWTAVRPERGFLLVAAWSVPEDAERGGRDLDVMTVLSSIERAP